MDDKKTGEDQTSSGTLHAMNTIVKNDLENISVKNSEDPALKKKDSSSKEMDTQLGILQFQNKFYECIEELKIRRVTDAENEDKINQLVSTQHDHQRDIKEEISKNTSLSEKHSQELSELKRQHEEKIHQLQAEKTKLALAADTWEKEMKEVKDDIRSLQLTKYSLEKTIKDQDQRLQMQGSARSSHLSKMTELEALGQDVSKQCSVVAEQLKRLEVNVKEAQKLHGKLAFMDQHQTCTSDSLKADLQRKMEEIVCLKAQLDEKPTQEVNEYKSVQSKHKQTEKLLKQKEHTCKQLSEHLEEARSANQNLLESLARSQQLSQRHLASSNQNADRASSLAMDVKKLESELCQLKDDLCTKEREIQTEHLRNEDLTTKLQIQEESLRMQLSSQLQENKSLLEAQETLEGLNISWSKKNSEMGEIIRELKEKISKFEIKEETKETKSTNTDPKLWQEKKTAEQKSTPEEPDKADNETVATQELKDDDTADNGDLPKKADNEVSKTPEDTSCDQVNMQIETSTTERVPSSAQCEQLELTISIKDDAPSPSQSEGKQSIIGEVLLIHDNPDTHMEAAEISPSDAKLTTGIGSEPKLELNAGRVIEVAAKQESHNETETSMQNPEMPCGNSNKKELQLSDNTVIAALEANTSVASQEIITNTGVSQEGVSQVCPHEANKTEIRTDEALKAVNIVDSTKMPTNLPDLEVNQVVLPKASTQKLSPEDNSHQGGLDDSSNVLHNQPKEKDITQQGLDEKILTKSEDANEIMQQTEDQPLQQTSIKRRQVSQDVTRRQPVTNLGRVNITNPLSSKRTSIFDQASKIQSPPTSYLNEASRFGTRSSYVLPGFPLLAAQPRYGVTPQTKLPSNMPPRNTFPRKTENIPESTDISMNEIPLPAKYQDRSNPSGKCSSTKETEGSQEWPNFAEEFESASGPSSAPLNIDYSALLRVKSTPKRTSTPAEVFPSVGSKRPSSSRDDDNDDKPLLFSDDDDQTDIKTEVASQIYRIQSFLRSDRLKRPRRSASNKGQVI
ncbi:paramyosin-like isoform X2 [Patiria miniata]|nr:paramyosin-like isoform X2 [Patiria miniata]